MIWQPKIVVRFVSEARDDVRIIEMTEIWFEQRIELSKINVSRCSFFTADAYGKSIHSALTPPKTVQVIISMSPVHNAGKKRCNNGQKMIEKVYYIIYCKYIPNRIRCLVHDSPHNKYCHEPRH